MKWLASVFLGGLALSACRADHGSVLNGDVMRGGDGQTVVPEYFGKKGYILTDDYLKSQEGATVMNALKQAGASFVAVLGGMDEDATDGVLQISVADWKGGRWARDVAPVSAVSHSSNTLRFVQFGALTATTKAIALRFGREVVRGQSLAKGSSLLINGYADCFVSEDKTLSAADRAALEEAFRMKAGCRRVTLLSGILTLPITRQIDQWVRFVSDDNVIMARLVDLTGREDTGEAPNLQGLRQFWDNEARAMDERGYTVTRLPVFAFRDGKKLKFASTVAGLLVQQHYFAPDFPMLRETFGERYQAEKKALEQEMGSLGFTIQWLPGDESVRLGGSLHRAVLSVHESS